MTDTRRRVKLYALNADRQWDDRGTGHVQSLYVDKLKGVGLVVRAESDGNVLLESKIQPDTAYQKQQETLIVWSEGDNYDLALSFQERAGCDEIWEKICQVQGKDPSVDITQDFVEDDEDERFDELSDPSPAVELPNPEMSKLDQISEIVHSCLTTAARREKLALALETDNYIRKLLVLFHECEDLDNITGLHRLYEIFKNIFLLNKNALFEIMFAEDVIFDVVGCLEYDPNAKKPKCHREYLRKMAKFREVVSINNPELLSKIHQTYRVQYIQDVILPPPSVFEENLMSSLSSFIFFNKVEIVSLIQEDERFLSEIFNQLSDETLDDQKRRDLVCFLKEFCTFSQTLQQQSREAFYKTLTSLGVLAALETTLAADDLSTKLASIDILSYIVEFSPSLVREYILQQNTNSEDEALLLNVIIEQLVCDNDPEIGGAVQLCGILRILLDPENMMASMNKSEKTDFLSFFYKHSVHVLIAPLLANTLEEDRPGREDFPTVQLLGQVLDLLSFCVEHHAYHSKNFILTRDLVRRVLVLMKSRHTFLALSALRFLRKIIALKDEFYNRYLIKGNLIAPVVDAFFRNQGRYNLLDSAIIELFEFIRLEDIKSLCTYVVDTFGKQLESVNYVQTFRALRTKYEQHQDRLKDRSLDGGVPPILRPSRFKRDPRQPEEDEELWFATDDDLEEEPIGPGPTVQTILSPVSEEGRKPLTPSNSPKSGSALLTALSNNNPSTLSGVAQEPKNSLKKGLVDYEGDSDEEENESTESETKRPKIS
ncbi:serine/threonine-protein phosphatase 4 regulatory subunit 3-like isoform X2 [Artemia franciscana]|uniref:serine/threonine-protein phosphatase 4 regulatory subunit 3-like isoform X2 n=1 Tax=Artemia franciscana TaxID=6661 RepID=UPI0032D9F073